MRQSGLFIKTKKTIDKKEEKTKSHEFLLQGDFIDQLSSGIYTFLPLGWKVHQKLVNIARKEMDALGAQEIFMPALQPKKLWQESGRWEKMDPPLFKFKDRHSREYALGSTHEEIITDLVRRRISSYKELPFAVYQIQTKFRNEMRSTGGLLRTLEFTMKDLYSFHKNEDELNKFYAKVKQSYLKIFKQTGIKIIPVEAESGSIGGKESHEYMLVAETGEDKIAICESCGLAVSQERLEKLGQKGIGCLMCKGSLIIKNCIESGHTFKLGTKYSEAMGAYFLDKNGVKKPILMGCYGIGIGRLLAAIVEASHDDKGIIWPEAIAPYQYHLLLLNPKNKIAASLAERIYNFLTKKGIEALFDDREEISAGEKLTEADLLGIPTRLVVSEKTGKKVEIKKRNSKKVKLESLEYFKIIAQRV